MRKNRGIKNGFLIILVLALLSLCVSVSADDDKIRMMKFADKIFKSGKHDEAGEVYERLAAQYPDSALINYNRGVIEYGKGEYKTAINAFIKALSTENIQLEREALRSLGNCYYRMSEETEGSNIEQSMGLCDKALKYYKKAMELDNRDRRSKFNFETVNRRKVALKTKRYEKAPESGGKGNRGEENQKKSQEARDEERKRNEDRRDEDKKTEDARRDEDKKTEEKRRDEDIKDREDKGKPQDAKSLEDRQNKRDDNRRQEDQKKEEGRKQEDGEREEKRKQADRQEDAKRGGDQKKSQEARDEERKRNEDRRDEDKKIEKKGQKEADRDEKRHEGDSRDDTGDMQTGDEQEAESGNMSESNAQHLIDLYWNGEAPRKILRKKKGHSKKKVEKAW